MAPLHFAVMEKFCHLNLSMKLKTYKTSQSKYQYCFLFLSKFTEVIVIWFCM